MCTISLLPFNRELKGLAAIVRGKGDKLIMRKKEKRKKKKKAPSRVILNAFETPGKTSVRFSSSSIACLVPLIPHRERFRNMLLFSTQSAQFVAN